MCIFTREQIRIQFTIFFSAIFSDPNITFTRCATSLTTINIRFRTSTEILNRSAFYTRKQAVHEAIFPSRKPHILFSARYYETDEFLHELSLRERPNRVGMMTVRTLDFRLAI